MANALEDHLAGVVGAAAEPVKEQRVLNRHGTALPTSMLRVVEGVKAIVDDG